MPTAMTEEEAKTKWCPMAMNAPQRAYKCRGDECMAWVWLNEPLDGPEIEWDGYCGLVTK